MTIYGIDVSHHQGDVDMRQVAREGFEFVFAKISEGTSFIDPKWVRNRDNARAAGLHLAGYHYVRAGTSPQAQADLVARAIGDQSIPIALDCEANSGDITHYRAVLAAMRARGLRVILSYIPRWYWEQLGRPDLSGLPPLWSSRYVNGTGYASTLARDVTDARWAGYGGNTVTVLQFTDKALVAGQRMDANLFAGTRGELDALFNLEAPVEPDAVTAILEYPIERLGLPEGHPLHGTTVPLGRILQHSDANLEAIHAKLDALTDLVRGLTGKVGA